MHARNLRRQVLLSTTMIVGALTAYGGRAYGQAVGGACVNAGGSTYECSGTHTEVQSITANDAQVTVVSPGLIVDTTVSLGNALSITGAGALSFTDTYGAPYSSLTAGTGSSALNITSTADSGNAGSIAIDTNGALLGDVNGIFAHNSGSGALTITANGNVTGTADAGIFAVSDGADLTVTTGATVSGGDEGIFLLNYAGGDLTVEANGNVTGTGEEGIEARNYAGSVNLTVTTAAGTTVMGNQDGIEAVNAGSGQVTVTANGDVTGANDRGIQTYNALSGTNLTVITATGTTVTGGTTGINADNDGSGAISITADGNVTGTAGYGIYANNSSAGTNLSITTASTVMGDTDGINAHNRGDGVLSVQTDGDVTGTTGAGIRAVADGSAEGNPGNGVTVTTGAGTTVSGDIYGIFATNADNGDLTINANGNVTGSEAIVATNGPNGTSLYVTTGATSIVDGSTNGIRAANLGDGQLSVTANGNVTSSVGDGIIAQNSAAGSDLSVTAGTGTTVMGNDYGIFADNGGSGTTAVNVNGNVYSTIYDAIYAASAGSGLTVTTGAGSTVDGQQRGISARHTGTGAVQVTANGNVTGTAGDGIEANNSATGTNLTVTTGGTVMGDDYGIEARNFGNGVLSVEANGDGTGSVTVSANGNVTGTMAGIRARNGLDGTDIVTVTTGAGTTVSGGVGINASNLGDGAVAVTANGNVTGTTAEGIAAENTNGTDLSVTAAAGSTVTGNTYGIEARAFGGALIVTADGNVTGTGDDGIFARNSGTSVTINVGSTSTVTSSGGDADDFAIETAGDPANVTVAGTLNGGGGGAIQFDQALALDDRLTLQTGATVNGNAFGGLGTDTLALQGTGQGAFNVSQLVDFETGEVDSGTWRLSGATTADFTVNGGTLKGTGTFGSLTINGGTISPGNSIGTMTVNGAFTLAAGSVFEVEVNAAGQSDKVIVNGTVNLTGATLSVLAANGNYKIKTEYVIIENDGTDAVNGTFASVTSSLAFLTPTVLYDGGTGNDVVLILVRNDQSFDDFGDTPNEDAVAQGLGDCPPTEPLCLAVLNLAPGQVGDALNQLSGEIHATVAGVLADDSRYVREAVLGRMRQALYTSSSANQVAALGTGGPQVASLDSQAMTLGYSGKSPSAPAAGLWPSGRGPMAPGGTSTATATRQRRTAISAASSRAWTRMSAARGAWGSPPAPRSPMSRSMTATVRRTWKRIISADTPAAW